MFRNLIDSLRLLFLRDKEPFLRFYSILGFYPRRIELYKLALRHKSCMFHLKNSSFGATANNERLEYLGDVVLGAVVADILYEHFSNKHEGFLTVLRSRLVKRETLNRLASDIGLSEMVEHYGVSSTAHNSYMCGNAFEALVGAIYLDRGYSYCVRFIRNRVFADYLDIDEVASLENNFKSRLIEWCQKRHLDYSYDVVCEKCEDGSNTTVFVSELYIEGFRCGYGEGYTKKESQQNASKSALEKLNVDKDLYSAIIKKNSEKVVPET